MGSEDSDGCRSDGSDSNDTKASKKRKPHVVALVLVCVFLFVGTVAVGGMLMGKKACQKGGVCRLPTGIRPADPTVSVIRPKHDSSDVLGVDGAVTDARIPDSVDILPPPEEQPESPELEEEKPTELAEENGAVEQLRPEAHSSRAGKFLRKNWKPLVAVAGAAAVGVGAHWIAQHGLPVSGKRERNLLVEMRASTAEVVPPFEPAQPDVDAERRPVGTDSSNFPEAGIFHKPALIESCLTDESCLTYDESDPCLTYQGFKHRVLDLSQDAPWFSKLEENFDSLVSITDWYGNTHTGRTDAWLKSQIGRPKDFCQRGIDKQDLFSTNLKAAEMSLKEDHGMKIPSKQWGVKTMEELLDLYQNRAE
jgi:hypothetical protein